MDSVETQVEEGYRKCNRVIERDTNDKRPQAEYRKCEKAKEQRKEEEMSVMFLFLFFF